jgi:hypothetical protein
MALSVGFLVLIVHKSVLVIVIVISPFVTPLANNDTLRMSLLLLVAGCARLLLAGLVARLRWALLPTAMSGSSNQSPHRP